MSRALSINQIYNKKRNLLEFEDEWKASIGTPELTGSWIIWGGSGSGKTTFVMMLCKYLTKFRKVAYNSLEEGDSESIRRALKTVEMEDVASRIVILNQEPIEDLIERLRRHKAPHIIVIDSIQYAELTYKQYKAIKDEFKNTLFIIISHAEGKEPEGKVAKKIRFDAMVKIRVEGYKAFPKSRYGGGEPFTIWQEGADKYHGNI